MLAVNICWMASGQDTKPTSAALWTPGGRLFGVDTTLPSPQHLLRGAAAPLPGSPGEWDWADGQHSTVRVSVLSSLQIGHVEGEDQ